MTIEQQFDALMEMLGRVPKRVRRRRYKGWRMPARTVSCTRPGKWGNPYYPGCGMGFGTIIGGLPAYWEVVSAKGQVRSYAEHLRLMKRDQPSEYASYIKPLRHMNLACFCVLCPEHVAGKPLRVVCEACQPCHVDVLLEAANA